MIIPSLVLLFLFDAPPGARVLGHHGPPFHSVVQAARACHSTRAVRQSGPRGASAQGEAKAGKRLLLPSYSGRENNSIFFIQVLRNDKYNIFYTGIKK